MTDTEELLERLYQETKITYEEYNAIKAVLEHKTLVIESYIQAEEKSKETLARRVEEKLNSLEIAVNRLQTNIVYARTELLRAIDKLNVDERKEKE